MHAAGKALFLDRDGVVNVDYGYVHSVDKFDFVDGIFEVCAAAVERGYALVIVTNQSGIGRGYFSEAQFRALMSWVADQFARRGTPLAGYYHCPDHPDGLPPHRRRSFMRKPAPGMLLRAADDHGLNLGQSMLIGDRESDIAAGQAAGLARTLLFAPHGQGAVSSADAVVHDLRDAAGWLDDRSE